ncbi:MAG: 3-hydroxybutyrate dehydrogenase [Pseudobdellovibrionaceae bacterium]
MSLKGKTAIITGSTSGIGHGIAEAFADEGMNIVLNGFGDIKEIENIMADLKKKGASGVSYNPADLTNGQAAAGMVEKACEEFGSVDILVNNAGIQHTAPIEDFPPEKWDLILSLMLTAPYHLIRTALPVMKKNKWGRIINIASVHGLVASPYKSAYVSAKHGLNGLTKVVALEAANTGVTCNSICPGWVLTPLVEKQVNDMATKDGTDFDTAKAKLLSEKQPQVEFTTTAELGALALYLCSDTARNMTGTHLSMDGGWSAR